MAEEKKVKRTRRKAAPAPIAEEAKAVEAKEEAVEVISIEEKDLLELQIEQMKQQNALLMEQIAQLKEQVSAAPKVIQISNDSEMVDFLWMAPVADDNELLIADGLFGKITGKVGNFAVPKKDLSRMLDSSMRMFIENRWLIVLGGMTDAERVQYGVAYKPGEILDKDIFVRLIDYGKDIVPIYEKLCDASRDVVAKLYYEAWLEPDRKKKVNRQTVVEMHKIAPKPAFKAIIDGMNQEDAQ